MRWVGVTLLCALLLVAVVATGQKLFYQAQLQGPAQLLASLTSSTIAVVTQITTAVNEERQVKAKIDKAERGVAKVAKTIKDFKPLAKVGKVMRITHGRDRQLDLRLEQRRWNVPLRPGEAESKTRSARKAFVKSRTIRREEEVEAAAAEAKKLEAATAHQDANP